MTAIVWIAVLFGIVAVVLLSIMMLLNARGCNSIPTNAYEQFESSSASPYADRIVRIQDAKNMVQTDIDRLGEIEDETCAIMSEIEEVFLKNSSAAPMTAEEYNLPADIQTKFANKRKDRAKLRWSENKKTYSALRKNVPLLECFVSGGSEETLATEVSELETLIQSPAVQGILQRVETTRASLGFNAEQLDKGLGPIITGSSSVNEGFASELRGSALLSKADELLGKAMAFHTTINELQSEVKAQANTTKNVINTSTNLLSGNIVKPS
jgi:hypothetical protein